MLWGKYQPGEIIGNKEVIYKHVDSNVFAISTTNKNNEFSVYLISSIDGEII